MASIEERLRQLVDENLEVDGRPLGRPLDMTTNLIAAGVSSMDAVAFIKLVDSEFNISIPAADLVKLDTLRSLADYIEGHAA